MCEPKSMYIIGLSPESLNAEERIFGQQNSNVEWKTHLISLEIFYIEKSQNTRTALNPN